MFYPFCIRSISLRVILSNAEPHTVFVSIDHLPAKVLVKAPASSVPFHISVQLILCFALTEVKKLKQLVRNVVDPNRDLGHVDRSHDGKGSGSVAYEKSYSMSTGQLSTDEAEESVQAMLSNNVLD